jgi:hypothetical protein
MMVSFSLFEFELNYLISSLLGWLWLDTEIYKLERIAFQMLQDERGEGRGRRDPLGYLL